MATLEHLLEYNLVRYYVLRGDSVFTNEDFPAPPIVVSINDPRNYKGLYTYNGWYRPKFNNILDFNHNEDSNIINIVEKDFTFSNTNFKEYQDISQMWYNKIVSQVTTTDVSTKNAIGYISGFNVFKSQWDADYYIRDISTYVDGYNSVLELPSYCGSKLVKLPSSLELEEWDITTAKSITGRDTYTLEYNLTRKIVNIFKSNTTFVENWSALTTSDSVIDGYIKKTILGYYNINKSKIKTEVWSKVYDGTNVLAYEPDSNFKLDTAANVDTRLRYVNNEYLYDVIVQSYPKKTYFIRFTLFEK